LEAIPRKRIVLPVLSMNAWEGRVELAFADAFTLLGVICVP